MSFSKLYRKRISNVGDTLYDRRFSRKQRSFNNFFENSLTRQKVLIDGVEDYVVIQDQTQSNNKDLSDDKYLIAKKETKIGVGSLIKWRDSYWIGFSNEAKTIDTHRQLKIRPSNYNLKYMNKNGEVCNNGLGVPAVVQNQTLYTLGVATRGKNAWVVNAKMLMYLIDNEESRNLGIGSRVYIGNAVYEIMFRDNVSRQGLIHCLMEESLVNENVDDVENRIADYYLYYDKDGNKLTKSNIEETTAIEEIADAVTGDVIETNEITIKITGYDDLSIGESEKYKAEIYINGELTDNNVDSWSVIDDMGSVSIDGQTGKDITIYAEDNYFNIDNIVNIIAKYKDVIVSKKVTIASPY